ncbi:MAG: phage major capsid protein [Firmicutes bacterium]|nr:phage major capsid protein [Bacillota bacterium]
MDLKEIRAALDEGLKTLKELLDQQDKEIKQFGETTTETAKAIQKTEESLRGISEDLKAAQTRMDELEAKMNRLPQGDPESTKSFGQLFVESDAYEQMIAAGETKSKDYRVKSFFTKTTLTGASLGNVPGYLYTPERLAEIMRAPDRTMRVRDLIPVLTTGVGAIEFVRETGFTNMAATVGEAPAQGKPESGLSFEIVSISVKTIAHWLPATRQILADAPQLSSYIDQRLIYGLKLVEDGQILYGDGLGNNLQGILTDSKIQSYKWSDGKAGDNKVDAIRRAMTRARLAEYPVTGIVLHPNDWEDIELMKGTDGHYIWIRVSEGGQQRLWRVPVVDTPAIQEGDFLVGAFAMGTALWDREEAAIRVSDSHDQFFIKNMVAILAEERLAQTIYRPEAFVLGQFDSAPPADSGS